MGRIGCQGNPQLSAWRLVTQVILYLEAELFIHFTYWPPLLLVKPIRYRVLIPFLLLLTQQVCVDSDLEASPWSQLEREPILTRLPSKRSGARFVSWLFCNPL